MSIYPDEEPLEQARARYFEENGFGADGGYSGPWFYVGWKWLAVPLPNAASRVRAVRLHDFHHIATGYRTTWRGEAEIGAWELAGGCGDYYPAWVLNLYSFAVGLAIAPRRLWGAFVRGRRCRNLYHLGFDDRWLQQPVGELRSRLGLPGAASEPLGNDRKAFVLTAAAALLQSAVTAAPFAVV